MARIILLESDIDASFHGLAVSFDDTKPSILASWHHPAPLSPGDCLQLAKDCAARVLAHLLAKGRSIEASMTNWVSVAAAMHAHIKSVNDEVRAAAYAAGERDAARIQEGFESEGGGVAGGARIQ